MVTDEASTRERLLAPLSKLGWRTYEALLDLLGALITLGTHLGLAATTLIAGNVMQRLFIDALAEPDTTFRAYAEVVTDTALLTVSVVIGLIGLLAVVRQVWADFRFE